MYSCVDTARQMFPLIIHFCEPCSTVNRNGDVLPCFPIELDDVRWSTGVIALPSSAAVLSPASKCKLPNPASPSQVLR